MNRREYQEVMFNSELPYPQRLLYAYLRSCVDYKTGIAGDADKKRISYQGIREALEYRRSFGSRTDEESFSRQRVYKMLGALEDRGLIVSMESEDSPCGRRPTIRKFLPLAVTGSIRPQEVVYKLGDVVGDGQSQSGQGFRAGEGYEVGYEVGDTSVISLSHNNKYIYYEPDDSDLAWVRYNAGGNVMKHVDQRGIDLKIETEKFNLRHSRDPGYDMKGQRQDWRLWIIRALEYKRIV